MRRASKIDRPAEVMRPFVWTAIIAFAAGFYGYLAVGALFGS
jgi:hypothetical protein